MKQLKLHMPNVTKIKYDQLKNKPLVFRLFSIFAEYFDDRIMTGKVFLDIYHLVHFLIFHSKEIYIRMLVQSKNSALTQTLLRLATKMGTLRIATDSVKIWSKYYPTFLLAGGISLLFLILLIYFFIINKFVFFSVFLPLLFLNSLCLAVAYVFID